MSKETYYSVKRDLLQCQKRPFTVSKETYKQPLNPRPCDQLRTLRVVTDLFITDVKGTFISREHSFHFFHFITDVKGTFIRMSGVL